MNDFTKEELVYLFNELDHNCMRYQEPDIAYEIKDKIQSMIDNYCDRKLPYSAPKLVPLEDDMQNFIYIQHSCNE